MTLSELAVKSEYRSDTDDFIRDFYLPCLSRSFEYWRAVGYFTSRGLAVAAQGVTALIKNDGRMSLVASPVLSEEDHDAIKQGYAARDGIIEKSLLRQFDRVDTLEEESRLGYLAWMISERRLDVRIALPVSDDNLFKNGIYHEKLGLFFDRSSNSIAFTGSPNETAGGLVDNFEAIDVFWSWDDSQNRVARKKSNFEKLWSNQTTRLRVIDFPEAVKRALLRFRPDNRPEDEFANVGRPAPPLNRWRHQDLAIAEFLKHKRGLLEMATGTGKTKTAMRICERLLASHSIVSIIVSADGNDLLDQWYSQLLELTSRLASTFAVVRDYFTYRERDRFLLHPAHSILLSSRPNLASTLRMLPPDVAAKTLLIHDEAHRVGSEGNRDAMKGLSDPIRFRLGLSATPDREYDQDGNDFITEHIGPVLYRFTLEDAIRSGILSPFTYYPLEYIPSAEDKLQLKQVHKRAAARRAAGDPMPQEQLWTELARVYKNSRAKIPIFDDFIKDHQELLARCIIFVETKEYGYEVLEIVHKYRHDFHSYFAEEDSSVLKRFASGNIECLLTCHRLSEGIDIRSLSTVILFSSSRVRLETIQRIGRCLRTDPNNPRKRANIVDFIRINEIDAPAGDESSDDERRNWLSHLSTIEPEAV